MKNRYYISTGAKENFYTLRYTFEEATARSVGDGLPLEIGSVTEFDECQFCEGSGFTEVENT